MMIKKRKLLLPSYGSMYFCDKSPVAEALVPTSNYVVYTILLIQWLHTAVTKMSDVFLGSGLIVKLT